MWTPRASSPTSTGRSPCGDFDWFPVGCWNFTDRKVTPSDFRLETTPVQPVEVRQVNDGVFYDFGRELMAFVKGTAGHPQRHGAHLLR